MNRSPLISQEVYDNLPDFIKQLVEPFSGIERDIVLLSCLGVLSNCLPNIKGVYDTSTVYPHLYIAIIAPPASGKGSMKHATVLMKKIDDELYRKTKAERDDCLKNSKKGETANCPKIKSIALPANISTSELYSQLSLSEHGLIMIVFEADTLSKMLTKEWADFSDVLRSCFHNEPLSHRRTTNDIYFRIDEPKLAMLITGTPNQLFPLLQSVDNGLTSRLMLYVTREIAPPKNVFAPNLSNIKDRFSEASEKVYDIYTKLSSLSTPIKFDLTDTQKEELMQYLVAKRNIITNNFDERFISSLYRACLMIFKLSQVLTTLRAENLDVEELYCTDEDFECSMKIIDTTLRHALEIFNDVDINHLSSQDGVLLKELNTSFTRQEAISIGQKYEIPKRTMDDKLRQWQRKRVITKVKLGHYKKL